jgi:hypothetical protein
MRNKILMRLLMLMALSLLILAIPAATSAQYYDRDRDQRREVHDALINLDNSSARLENDVSYNRGRRVLGVFWLSNSDPNTVAEVRDFRRAVRQLRNASAGGRDLSGSYDEARVVLDRGVQLDRYLRLRTGRTSVDADLSEIRSSLNIIANAYDMRINY